MLSKDEYLKKLNTTEEKLKEKGMEIVAYDDGSPDSEGWDIRYIDDTCSVVLGCPCSNSGTLHDKL